MSLHNENCQTIYSKNKSFRNGRKVKSFPQNRKWGNVASNIK
jgi:hypothetical protein